MLVLANILPLLDARLEYSINYVYLNMFKKFTIHILHFVQ